MTICPDTNFGLLLLHFRLKKGETKIGLLDIVLGGSWVVIGSLASLISLMIGTKTIIVGLDYGLSVSLVIYSSHFIINLISIKIE